jgi:hypothetical protein
VLRIGLLLWLRLLVHHPLYVVATSWLLSAFGLGGSGLGLVVGVWLECGLLLSNTMLFEKSCV